MDESNAEGMTDGGRALHESKMSEFQGLTDTELKKRLKSETKKAFLEEKVRGSRGASTSETQWNIVAIRGILEDRSAK